MAKKFAYIEGFHNVYEVTQLTSGQYSYRLDMVLQTASDRINYNTICFIVADDQDNGRLLGDRVIQDGERYICVQQDVFALYRNGDPAENSWRPVYVDGVLYLNESTINTIDFKSSDYIAVTPEMDETTHSLSLRYDVDLSAVINYVMEHIIIPEPIIPGDGILMFDFGEATVRTNTGDVDIKQNTIVVKEPVETDPETGEEIIKHFTANTADDTSVQITYTGNADRADWYIDDETRTKEQMDADNISKAKKFVYASPLQDYFRPDNFPRKESIIDADLISPDSIVFIECGNKVVGQEVLSDASVFGNPEYQQGARFIWTHERMWSCNTWMPLYTRETENANLEQIDPPIGLNNAGGRLIIQGAGGIIVDNDSRGTDRVVVIDGSGIGGGEGDKVSWAQIAQEGTPIATITINGTPQVVYAPKEADVQWRQLQDEGTAIAEITINGQTQTVYAPEGGGVDETGHIYTPGFDSLAEGVLPEINTLSFPLNRANAIRAHAEGIDTEVGQNANGGHTEGIRTNVTAEAGHAEGYETRVTAKGAHAEGNNTTAMAEGAHAEGHGFLGSAGTFTWGSSATINSASPNSLKLGDVLYSPTSDEYRAVMKIVSDTQVTLDSAFGVPGSGELFIVGGIALKGESHAEGYNGVAYADNSHAEGRRTSAVGKASHAEGGWTKALGNYSHAEGHANNASGDSSHVEGFMNSAKGEDSHVEGFKNTAHGSQSHAEGYRTIANESQSHAEGDATEAIGKESHAEGLRTEAGGNHSHAEGCETKTQTNDAHAEGFKTKTGKNARASHAEGCETEALGHNSHAEGGWSKTAGNYAHAEGFDTKALSNHSHAEGYETLTGKNAKNAHAEGLKTYARGGSAHAEGVYTEASSMYSHAEGCITTSLGESSHAEGGGTKALGRYSHAEGKCTGTYGTAAHAEGKYSIAIGKGAHSEGVTDYIPLTIHNYTYITDKYVKITDSNIDYRYDGAYLDDVKLKVGDVIIKDSSYKRNLPFDDYDLRYYMLNYYCAVISEIGDNYITCKTNFNDIDSGNTYHIFSGVAAGNATHSEGLSSNAYGNSSHAEGKNTGAYGAAAHSEGKHTGAYGQASHAEGYKTRAIGKHSHAEGKGNYDEQINSVYNIVLTVDAAEKQNIYNQTGVNYSYKLQWYEYLLFRKPKVVDGNTGNYISGVKEAYYGNYNGNSYTYFNIENGSLSNRVGYYFYVLASGGTAYGDYSHVEGLNSIALGEASHSEGHDTKAIGRYSHAEGESSRSRGESSHAEGYGTKSKGMYSHAEGESTESSGCASHAEGHETKSKGIYSHAEGYTTSALGEASHSEGSGTKALGAYSHAEGCSTYTLGEASHAEGFDSKACGYYSHAEGWSTEASGKASHSEGYNTKAWGDYSHASGYHTRATREFSYSEGFFTKSKGMYSHAEGCRTWTRGKGAHSGGIANNASTKALLRALTPSEKSLYPDYEYLVINVENSSILNSTAFDTVALYDCRDYKPYYENYLCTATKAYIKSKGWWLLGGTGGAYVPVNRYITIKMTNSNSKVYAKADGSFVHGYAYNGSTIIANGNGSVIMGYADKLSGIYVNENDGYSRDGGVVIGAAALHGKILAAGGSIAIGVATNSGNIESTGSMDKGSCYRDSYTGNFAGGHSDNGNIKASGAGAFAYGYSNTKTEDGKLIADGAGAHAEGISTKAFAGAAHAEGSSTIAKGNNSHAEGNKTSTYNNNTHAEGEGILERSGIYEIEPTHNNNEIKLDSTTSGINFSYRKGSLGIFRKLGDSPSIEDPLVSIISSYSIENGDEVGEDVVHLTLQNEKGRHDTKYLSNCYIKRMYGFAYGNNSHVENEKSIALGKCSHAEGSDTISRRSYAHAEGKRTLADGPESHAEGLNTKAYQKGAHSEGYASDNLDVIHVTLQRGTDTKYDNTDITIKTIEGTTYEDSEDVPVLDNLDVNDKIVIGFEQDRNTDQGTNNLIGIYQGYNTSEEKSTDAYKHYLYITNMPTQDNIPSSSEVELTEGNYILKRLTGIAHGNGAHIEGCDTLAINHGAHAEGKDTVAKGAYSHVEGQKSYTGINGTAAHAEGYETEARGIYSHAEGYQTVANGDSSHASGKGTYANQDQMFAIGRYNQDGVANELFTIGNGSGSENASRRTVFKVVGTDGGSSSSNCTVTINGGGTYTDTWAQSSDARKKNIISDISLEKAYDLIDKCQTIVYTLKDDPSNKEQIGLIAQEVKEFFPEIITEDADGYLALDYSKLTVVILKVLKDLIIRVSKLESK